MEIYVGERLYRLRKKRGLSLEEVGLGVGVTSSHISQIENGKRQPSFNLLSTFAQYFDVDPTFFIDTKNKFYGQGRRIRAFREVQGVSIEELARKTDLEVTYLQNVEESKERLEIAEMQVVAQALDKDIIDFHEPTEIYLNHIREICDVIFNMAEEEIEQAIEFIRKKVHLDS